MLYSYKVLNTPFFIRFWNKPGLLYLRNIVIYMTYMIYMTS